MHALDLYRLDREESRDPMWEQLICRQRYRFTSSAHIMSAVDSQVAVSAIKKGRSSSKALNHILWICTEKNPADAPTRKKHIPPPEEPESTYFERRALAMRDNP
eukprot:2776690-Amphidinium_carterae.2